ncbi:hypothetical protein EI427_21580 [Flammeovirga pectinis]|uniref:Uncharacterized protein n=1 Tax=Flammeovirga pectinis TaxID=2494373 RepID=A0A3Q9FUF4_9BACT|nr:hypothetical protein [Flammeovirga pectinis]AZQ64819.1 hypothetical protein EI427_21580 [Flammeovirga pectinis]
MNMAGIEKQGTPDHKFQYNGKEKQKVIGFIDSDGRSPDDIIIITLNSSRGNRHSVNVIEKEGRDRIYVNRSSRLTYMGSTDNGSSKSYTNGNELKGDFTTASGYSYGASDVMYGIGSDISQAFGTSDNIPVGVRLTGTSYNQEGVKTKASLYLGESDTGWFSDKNISKNTTPMAGKMAGSLYSMFGVLTEMLSWPGTNGSNNEPKSQPDKKKTSNSNSIVLDTIEAKPGIRYPYSRPMIERSLNEYDEIIERHIKLNKHNNEEYTN